MMNHVFIILGNDQIWVHAVLSMFKHFYSKLTAFNKRERERQRALCCCFFLWGRRERAWVKLERGGGGERGGWL